MVTTSCLVGREGGVGVVAIQAPKDFPNGSEGDATIGHVCKKLPSTKSGGKETTDHQRTSVYTAQSREEGRRKLHAKDFRGVTVVGLKQHSLFELQTVCISYWE